jgi:uncharacterized protein YciI
VKFDTFTFGFLVGAENAAELSDAEADALQDAHLAHLASLQKAGHLGAAGPVRAGDDASIRGFLLFLCDRDTASALAAEDPAVQAGRFTVELFTWMVPAGTIQFGTGTMPHSIAEASGP